MLNQIIELSFKICDHVIIKFTPSLLHLFISLKSRFIKLSTCVTIYRIERVLYKETNESDQNVVISKRDDVTLFTGGNDGILQCWSFELKKGKGEGETENETEKEKERACDMIEKNKMNLFDTSISVISLNPSESYVRMIGVV